ncbi:MAG: EamA family transporter RarD, partial [Anaerolineae bacterium]
MNKGILYAIGTYGLWGILPIFWKALQAVPAAEILPHRMVWSLVLMVIILSAGKHWRLLAPTIKKRVTLV